MFIENVIQTLFSPGECLNGIHTVDLVGTEDTATTDLYS